MRRSWGRASDSAMGRPFRKVWADVWEQIGSTVEAVLAGGSERFIDMPLSMAREGVLESTFWTFSFSPVRDARDEIVALLCITTEQTGRIAKEQQLGASNAALRSEVARGLADLDRAEDQLRQSQKLEAIGQLTGGVGARLQQPPDRDPRIGRTAASRGPLAGAPRTLPRRHRRDGRARHGADAPAPRLRATPSAEAGGVRRGRERRRGADHRHHPARLAHRAGDAPARRNPSSRWPTARSSAPPWSTWR